MVREGQEGRVIMQADTVKKSSSFASFYKLSIDDRLKHVKEFAGTFRASSTFLAPVRNIAVLSSIRTVSSFSLTSSSPPDVDLRNGSACPNAFAPNASALAPCSPFLTPPDAITVSFVDLDTSTMLEAVGIPQSQKTSPSLSCKTDSFSRAR